MKLNTDITMRPVCEYILQYVPIPDRAEGINVGVVLLDKYAEGFNRKNICESIVSTFLNHDPHIMREYSRVEKWCKEIMGIDPIEEKELRDLLDKEHKYVMSCKTVDRLSLVIKRDVLRRVPKKVIPSKKLRYVQRIAIIPSHTSIWNALDEEMTKLVFRPSDKSCFPYQINEEIEKRISSIDKGDQ